jgi:arylsulfatase A-like enzyme
METVDEEITSAALGWIEKQAKAKMPFFLWYNMVPYLTGEVKESPRNNFFYVSDDGGIMAVRIGDYKLVFQEQRATHLEVWAEPFVKLRLPQPPAS